MKIKLLGVLLVGLMGSCATNSTPPAIIPPAPQKVESALPIIRHTKQDVNDGITTNTDAGKKLSEQEQKIKEQTEGIDRALAISNLINDKIKLKQSVVEKDTTGLLTEMGKVKSNNMFLELSNHDLIKLKDTQDTNLMKMSASLDAAEEKIINKDNEATQLREQYTYLSQSLVTKNNEVVDLNKALTKEKETSATALVYKHWVWGLVGGFLLWCLVKNLIMIYFPMIKFRV